MRRVVIIAILLGLLVGAPAQAWAATGARVDDPAQRAGHAVGSIEIDAIGLDEVIREGVAQSVIDMGVAHWVGTATPGEQGNLVLAGHRTTFTRPFYDVDLLQPGDLIEVRWTGERGFAYEVTETFVVDPTAIWIVDETEQPTLTLFACHPKGSERQRIVVRAVLVPPSQAGRFLHFPI